MFYVSVEEVVTHCSDLDGRREARLIFSSDFDRGIHEADFFINPSSPNGASSIVLKPAIFKMSPILLE